MRRPITEDHWGRLPRKVKKALRRPSWRGRKQWHRYWRWFTRSTLSGSLRTAVVFIIVARINQ